MTLRSAYEHVVLLDEEQNPVGTLQKRVAHHEHTPRHLRKPGLAYGPTQSAAPRSGRSHSRAQFADAAAMKLG